MTEINPRVGDRVRIEGVVERVEYGAAHVKLGSSAHRRWMNPSDLEVIERAPEPEPVYRDGTVALTTDDVALVRIAGKWVFADSGAETVWDDFRASRAVENGLVTIVHGGLVGESDE